MSLAWKIACYLCCIACLVCAVGAALASKSRIGNALALTVERIVAERAGDALAPRSQSDGMVQRKLHEAGRYQLYADRLAIVGVILLIVSNVLLQNECQRSRVVRGFLVEVPVAFLVMFVLISIVIV